MKKVLFVALALLASASFSTASAQSKKDKKKKKAQTEQTCCQEAMAVRPVVLATPSDSVSYAAGYMLTDGLETYLKQQFQVSDADMPAVMQGFRQAMTRMGDKKFKAVFAGMQVAEMLHDRMMPRVKDQINSETDSINEALVVAGFEAGMHKDTTNTTLSAAKTTFEQAAKVVSDRKVEAAKKDGVEFLAANAKKEGVNVLPSGLQYKVLTAGTGSKPTLDDKVRVVYEGRTIDGHVFDATSKHNLKDVDYDEFKVKGLIKGWQEALTMMPVGSKWEIYIPYNLAYGERGAGKDIKPYAALVFTMELKGIAEADKDQVSKAQKANPKIVRSQTAPVGKKKK